MRSALLVLALGTTQAISAPRAKTALQLRGGGLDDLDVVQVGAAALGAAGLNQWISPKASFEIYGVTKADASALALRRGVGAWQLGLAYLLTAENPLAASLFTAAASCLALIPNCEAFDAPKEPILAWIALLVALGTKSSDISPWVGAGLYLGNGVMSYFFTEETLKMYGCTGKKGLSKLGVATQKLTGAMMLFTGAFLAALAAGKEPLEAFGITAALICAHVAIFVFHGAPDDYNKLPLAWLALFGGLAFKALN